MAPKGRVEKKLPEVVIHQNKELNVERDGNQGQRDPERDGGTPQDNGKRNQDHVCITTRPNWSRSEGSRDRYFQKVKLNVHLMHLELSGADLENWQRTWG